MKHPNIVLILSVHENGLCPEGLGRAALIQMELCQGDLDYYLVEVIKRGWRFSYLEYASLLLDVASGVAFMHANRLIHRDIKPQNSKP